MLTRGADINGETEIVAVDCVSPADRPHSWVPNDGGWMADSYLGDELDLGHIYSPIRGVAMAISALDSPHDEADGSRGR